MRARWLFGFAVVWVLGCGGSKTVVPVSGKVTLNGKPLANATVSFQPIPDKGVEAGPGSAGKTNDQGEFSLKTYKGENGAQVGKHHVLITSLSPDVGDSDKRPRPGRQKDAVPARFSWNGKDAITFEVPSGGTDKANFDLKSP